jgi:hypothetical protein
MEEGMRVYTPVEAGRVSDTLVAFAEETLELAQRDLGYYADFALRWFADAGDTKHATGLRETFVNQACLGFTGANNDWRTIWVKVSEDPRQIVQVVAHEVYHAKQHSRHGDAILKDNITHEAMENAAWDYGVAFRQKLLPLSTGELQQKAHEVARKYGG